MINGWVRRLAPALAVLLLPILSVDATAGRERHAGPRQAVSMSVDRRYGHNRAYPVRGASVHSLPPGAAVQRFNGAPYYFYGGAWYRPTRGGYVVIGPPIGLFVPFLPPFYTAVWFGGIPYYYSNDAYYLWNAERQGYVVVDPPPDAGQGRTQLPGSDQLYVYPKSGQSQAQLDRDRYECHVWARGQTGFDPTQAVSDLGAGQDAAKRDEYRRAQQACLEGRGYTAR